MENKRCFSCRCFFYPCPKTPAQRYCSAPACQLERRRRWQKEKRKNDIDYKENQRQAQKNWCQRNADYWRQYRKKSRLCGAVNSESSGNLLNKAVNSLGVKMGALDGISPFESGIYSLQMHSPNGVVKMGALIVKITVISVD
jgi:hypothetical protein